MSTDDPRKPAAPPTDPRLKSFLRQARAIISVEKGLTPTSRVKLQSLAARLKLSRPLFNEALDRLQSSPAASLELTRYEKAFIQFLNAEFDKLSGGVLSLGMEKNAIDLANRKFQINNARAEQLLQAQSEASGISRISPDEAIAFAEQTILDQIGDLAAVDDEMQLKLQKIGNTWGLAPADIDRLISRRLTINRSQQSRGRGKTAIAMLATAVLLGGLWAVYATGLLSVSDRKPVAPQLGTTTEPGTIGNSWVPDSVLKQIESLSQSSGPLNSSLERIQNDNGEQRRQAYQQLIDASCNSDSPAQEQINSLIGKLFFLDPDDDAALEITRRMHAMLSPASTENSLLPSNLKIAYRANRVLAQLLLSRRRLASGSEADFASRIQALQECIRSDIGVSIKPEESIEDYLTISEQAIATDQWNRLIQSSWSSPGNAAAVVEPLVDLTQSILSPETINQYRDESVLSIMDKDSSRWRYLRNPITQSIKHCDEYGISEWIKVYSKAGDGAAQDLIGELLLQRIDVKPKSQRRQDIAEAIEKYGTQYRYRVLRPAMDRSVRIDKHYSSMMEQGNAASVLPDRISQMALAVNVEFAFCAAINNATHLDDSSFAEFDRLIALPPPRLRELISLPIDRRGIKSIAPSSATASDERRKSTSLERLADLAPDSSGRRILALRQLERVAHRFERISYADAVVLADYFLANLGREELLECESRLESFSHWPNLTLAIADTLPGKDIKIDQALTVTRLLTGREFDSSGNSDWKEVLQLDLMEAVASTLENQIDQDPNNIKSNWTRLKLYLNENHRQRQAIALSQVAGSAYSTPFQATLDLIDGLVETTPWRSSNRSLQRATNLVRQSALNEIEKAVFANQLLIQFLSTELSESDQSTNVAPILSALQNSFRKSELPGEHLYATERTLFQLMDLKRKTLVNQLIKQN